MQHHVKTQRYERKRKAMLILPLIVLPFIIFIGWITGIVGPANAQTTSYQHTLGINTSLPAAIPAKDSSWDKLSFYEKADKDSARLRQLQRQDPYLNKHKKTDDLIKKYKGSSSVSYSPNNDQFSSTEEQEKKVYERINAIHREMNRTPTSKKKTSKDEIEKHASINTMEVDRLERMMEMINTQPKEEDPEMQQLASFIESIKDIQHPERVKERMKKQEVRPKLYSVELQSAPSNPVNIQTNRFFSLETDASFTADQNTTEAVVHDQQTVTSNELVKLRLLQSIYIGGIEIPAHHFVYGVAKIDGNRLKLKIPAVQINGKVFPVSLDVMGQDGIEGIVIHHPKMADAVGNTLDRSSQGLSLTSLDPSIGGQLAAAAIQSGKTLVRKQAKTVRYTIPSGYKVFLMTSQ